MYENVTKNLNAVLAEIEPCKPKTVAVTKYFDYNGIIAYYNAGIRDFAENRIKDALEKIEKLPDEIVKSSTFHLIGHLQTNKVKDAVGNFDFIQSVDSVKLARKISEVAKSKGIVQKILIQINNANEKSKFGFSKEDFFRSFEEISRLENISVEGVMTIAPKSDDEAYLASLFDDISNIVALTREKTGMNLPIISMGMSNDFKIAAKHGSTMLRLGRVLLK